MTVSYVGSNTAANTNTGVLPGSIVSGDVLIWEATSVSGTTPALPTGWTSLGTANNTIYGAIDYTGTAPSLIGSGLSGNSNITISAFRGTKTVANLTNFAVSSAASLGHNTTVAPASLGTAPASASLTAVFIGGHGSSTDSPASTVPTGYTSQYYNHTSGVGWQQQCGTANTTTNPGRLTWSLTISPTNRTQSVCMLSIELPIGQVEVDLTVSVSGAATVSAVLSTPARLTASASGVATASITLSTPAILPAVAAAGAATAAAVLSTPVPVSVTAAGSSTAAAQITANSLVGAVAANGTSTATALLTAPQNKAFTVSAPANPSITIYGRYSSAFSLAGHYAPSLTVYGRYAGSATVEAIP